MAKLGRPTKPLISKENAIQVALEVIDEQGLEALSLERVAKRIGVRAPSLYHHFHNKAELLREVAKSILKEIEVPPMRNASWEKIFVNLCLATRHAILQHPRAGLLLLQYFPRTLLLGAYDFWTSKCPYPAHVQMLILDGAEKITFGSAFFAAAAEAYEAPVMPDFPVDRYPALARAVAKNEHGDDDALFAETIEVFLDGLKARYGDQIVPVAAVIPAPKPAAKKITTTKMPPVKKKIAAKAKVTVTVKTKVVAKSKVATKSKAAVKK